MNQDSPDATPCPWKRCSRSASRKGPFGSEQPDATVERVQAPPQLQRRESGEAELAPSHLVVAVARVAHRVDDDPRAERLDPVGDLVEPPDDMPRGIAPKEIVAARRESHDVGGRGRTGEVGQDAVRRVAIPRQVYEVGPERPREL